jgi:glycosyltransferase involved in cell wall biosynthesis
LIPKTENRFRFALPTVSEVEAVFKKEKIDILHILLPTPLAFISIRAARKLGIKVVIHSHAQPENTTESIPAYLGKHIVKFFLSSYFSWLYKQADYLIYPTQFAQDIFSKHNNIIQNTVISNGVDTSIFIKTETDSLFTKYNLPRNTKNILFVGRLHPEKNIETLIKSIPSVLEKNANIHLYIVGPGFQKDELRKLTTKLKLDKNITFFGKVTNEELLMAYNSCDVFILPSIAELEGMVVLEAMSCGKPIIIANSKSSASRFFVNENGFLFETKDYQDLANKISAILDDDNLRENMGRKSLDLSRGYDIQRSIDKLENVYYSLIKNNI